ncbi:MAG: hypothetical protein COB25_010395 [Oceanospirillales bacterium]|jgi:hypothetical protein|uniref:hypothetical protein n=1 Tax=Marinobacter sp. 1-3A TaxID=2582920 RepID=UPI000BCDFC2B|nr:hypothetical protein [Marinobacter sp. 1-3A]MBK1872611.1 hypothetical protein [Marinobacter sp. 1-3A]MBL1272848.1 hypothetical protein [Oceanospirillales bacterium]
MKRVTVILMTAFLGSGASIALAGSNGGQADRYNEARSFPVKSVDDSSSGYQVEESDTVKKLKEEHRQIKELIGELLKKQ